MFMHAFPLVLNSQGNNSQLEIQLRFFLIGVSQIYEIPDKFIRSRQLIY